MAKPPSFSVAPGDRRRSRILSWGGLAGMIGLAAAGLVLVFPQDDLLRLVRGDGTGPGDRELTVAYLQNMVRASPRDANLRLLLAGKLLAAGDLQGARQMLDEAQPLIVPASEAVASWER